MQVTVFKSLHERAGARMVDFAGWFMPVQYEGIVAEHLNVRSNVGLFDVSHMGRIMFGGPQHIEFIDRIATNKRAGMAPGQIRYNLVCNEQGTILDDVLIYAGLGDANPSAEDVSSNPPGALIEGGSMIVCNAGNHDKIAKWLRQRSGDFDVAIHDCSASHAMLALQGPKSQAVLSQLTEVELDAVKYYRLTVGTVNGVEDVIISRTGYTGEDGFELIFPNAAAESMWNALSEAGKPHGLAPAGLGCRDTLRLEAGMPLYGHEIDDKINPLEAGLKWAVKLKKSNGFIGSDALKRAAAEGVKRKLTGLKIESKRIARQGMRVLSGGEAVGMIMSGTKSPTLGDVIATTLIPANLVDSCVPLEVELKPGVTAPAVQTSTQFYKRER